MNLETVRAELDAKGESAFVRRYGQFFVVLTDAPSISDVASFVITSTRLGDEFKGKRRGHDVDIRPLVKAPFPSEEQRITLGRDEKCDLAIAHARVSKVHAHFSLLGGLVSVVDIGSKNGTRVNGVPLEPGQPCPIDAGDTLEFGPVSATLWSAADVLAAVRSSDW